MAFRNVPVVLKHLIISYYLERTLEVFVFRVFAYSRVADDGHKDRSELFAEGYFSVFVVDDDEEALIEVVADSLGLLL